MKVIAKPSQINEILEAQPLSYKEAVQPAFRKIEQNSVISSWKDAISSGVFHDQLSDHIQVPNHGCFKDVRSKVVMDEAYTLNKIWSIGGKNGRYGFNLLWRIRGDLDKMFGGVGLRRGRRHDTNLEAGDPLDFWRVLLADKKQKRLHLFADMKLPGEVWLEFKIVKGTLFQRLFSDQKGFGSVCIGTWYYLFTLSCSRE